MINVFLASSSKYRFGNRKSNDESKEQLRKIIRRIDEKLIEEGLKDNVSITPWWNCIKFKTPGDALDSLLQIVHEYDMGIFVFGNDIKGKERGKRGFFPNNNVLIELGMFKMKKKRTFIIEDGNDIIRPSDIGSANVIKFTETNSIIDGFIETIKAIQKENYQLQQNQYNDACVYYDYELPSKFIKFNDSSNNDLLRWNTKALFVGSKSAYLWSLIENKPSYVEPGIIENFINHEEFKSIIGYINNVVSFGPGSGKIDEALMSVLLPKCYYIPIDLNASLAIKSVELISKLGRKVPFAVIDDFEAPGCYPRLSRLIEEHKNDIGKNNLFSMLGVTFSNLTMNCTAFSQRLNEIMRDEKDHLLLDVIIYDKSTGKTKYKTDSELKKKIKEQITTDYWDIIHNSITKKRIVDESNKKPDKNQLTKGIHIQTYDNLNDINIYTNVLGTKVVSVTYSGNTLFIAKYYKYEEIYKFFEKQFTIIHAQSYPKEMRGVFLLKKKTR